MNNKPFTMIVKETEKNIIDICNESGLSPAVLDLIMQKIYSKIHSLAERQSIEEEAAYVKMLKESSKNTEVADKD